jgi:hypothetical protein
MYMKEAVNSGPKMPIIPPKNIVFVRIDRKSGKLSTPGNPDSIFETFKEGSQPTEYAEPPKPEPIPRQLPVIEITIEPAETPDGSEDAGSDGTDEPGVVIIEDDAGVGAETVPEKSIPTEAESFTESELPAED